MTTQQSALEKKIRHAVGEGLLVVIVGWKASNHNRFTRGLLHGSSAVRFCERLPKELPQKTGIIIMTRFVDHQESNRARAYGEVEVVPKLNKIKTALRACEDVLMKPGVKREAVAAPLPTIPEVREERAELLGVTEPPPTVISIEKTGFAFAKAFLEAMGGNVEGFLGKRHTSQLIRSVLGSEYRTKKLVSERWLEPVVGEGRRKVGKYKAGPRMLECLTAPEPEPQEPLARARWFLSREPDLRKRREQLVEELERIDAELQKTEQAKALLKQLEELIR